MSQEQMGLGRKEGDSPNQAFRMSQFPFTGGTTARKARFWKQDGAWLNQNGYGTCVAFALGHRVADKPWEQIPYMDNQWAFKLYRDATGDDGMQDGTWANIVAEELFRRNLITRFEWIISAPDLRFALLERGSVPVGIPWYNSMFNPVEGADGKAWVQVNKSSGLAGGHEVLINGFRLEAGETEFIEPFYRIKNSWGRWWGDDGNARIAADDLENLVFNDWGDAIWIKEPGA